MQEIAALTIVVLAGLILLIQFYRSFLAQPLSKMLLKRGRVKLALKVKSQARKSGCENCDSD